MAESKFRLGSVSITGFKAFTISQTVELSGKHLFIFGDNGRGKSSIVEAIRWALFGLAGRETEVRNQFYDKGDCRVELRLIASDGNWSLTRQLRAGSGRSDLEIKNPKGETVLQSQVFPHIARLGPKEGTHIIFAAQQASQRRPQADISDFDKVLYSYLHLEDIPDLLSRLDSLIEEQLEAERQIGEEVSDTEAELKEALAKVQVQLDEILRNPPWSEDSIPTLEETTAKIEAFAKEVAQVAQQEIALSTNLAATLEHCERVVSSFSQLQRADLETELRRLASEIQELKELAAGKSASELSVGHHAAAITRIELDISSTTNGKAVADFEHELKTLKEHQTEHTLRYNVTKAADAYYSLFPQSECVLCHTHFSDDHLVNSITESIALSEPEDGELSSKIFEIDAIVSKLRALTEELNDARQSYATASTKYSECDQKLRIILDISESASVNEIQTNASIEALEKSRESIERSLREKESVSGVWSETIQDLRQELRFQTNRRRSQEIEQDLLVGLEPARTAFADFVNLLVTTQSIREKLQTEFNNSLDQTLPEIGTMMTDVYRRLTQQLSFERVFVQRGTSESRPRTVNVRVSSERAPELRCNPEDVLNGQAINALQLVPYFVFSQFQSEALELDLLIVDDPSQSFDTSRVKLLMQELATAASHAQLIIATHEEERFHSHIPSFFKEEDYAIIRIPDFTPDKGPVIDVI